MKISIKKPIAVLSAILIFAITLSLSFNVFARTVPPQGTSGPLNMQLSSEGILSWDSVSGATSYNADIYYNGQLEYTDYDLNIPSFGFIDDLDYIKADSGRYEVQVTPMGVANPGDHQDFYYVSPFEKLQTPINIVWDNNTISWNAVENATGYVIAKYDTTGNLVSPYINVDSTSYTFLPNPDDGIYVKIKATASGYRDSDFAESPLKGSVERSIATQAKEGVLHMYLNSEGILSWDEVTGATAFEVRISHDGMIITEEVVYGTSFELVHFLDESRVDSGEISVHVRPVGVESHDDEQTFSYVSCWSKLDAPANPRWDGDVAHWDEVPGTETYLITLYDSYGHVDTADLPVEGDTSYDFSTYHLGEGWFFTVKASNIIPGQVKRDSAVNESPKKAPIPIETVNISVAEPTVGAHPDFFPRVEDDSNYHIDYADYSNIPSWFLYADGYPSLTSNDSFEYDKSYGFTLHIVANDNYALTDDTTYTVNGREASKIGGELPSWAFVKLDFTMPPEPIPITYYTASFDSHDGSEVASQVIAEGGTVNRPEDPVWDGHVFLGWYTSSEYTEEYDFSSSVNQDLTIHAKWAIAIPSASATITTPMGTKYPDFSPEAGGDTYTVTVNDWYLYEEPYDSLSTSSHFQDGKEYALRLAFEPNEGYAFTNDATFTINGLSTSCYGRINDREVRFIADTPTYIHSASATVTTPVYRAHPDFNPTTTDGNGYRVELEGWRLYDSSLDYPLLNPDSTFESGEDYELGYYLRADDTHAFANDATFTLNGQPAYSVGGDGSTYIFIRYWFEIPIYNITTSVYDLTSQHSAVGCQTKIYTDKNGWSNLSYDGNVGYATSTTSVNLIAEPDADYEFVEWRVGSTDGDVFSLDRYKGFVPEGDIHLVAIVRRMPTTVSYTTHVQSYGWQDYVKNGAMAGTSGEAKRLEAIKIKLEHAEHAGDIEYRTHIQTYGWEEEFKQNDEVSGTSGEAKRLEAIEIRLTGEMAEHYDIYYRVHAQTFGWLGWAKNGEKAGTEGFAKRLEGIEILLVDKGEFPCTECGNIDPFKEKQILYTTHVQTYGWQDYAYDGNMAGTSGEAKRLEAIKIKLNNPKYEGDVEYRTHIQTYGWEETFKKNDEMSGTSGEAKRLEAIEIRLTGEMAEHYDIYYRVHAQTFGWLAYAKNGEPAGTAGFAKRLEGIEILLMPKGEVPPVPANQNNDQAYIENNN